MARWQVQQGDEGFPAQHQKGEDGMITYDCQHCGYASMSKQTCPKCLKKPQQGLSGAPGDERLPYYMERLQVSEKKIRKARKSLNTFLNQLDFCHSDVERRILLGITEKEGR
jgi:hypothetical protein